MISGLDVVDKMFLVNIVTIITLCWGISSATNSSAVGNNCVITDFSHVSQVTNSCNNIVVKNVRVPAKQTLTLQLKTGSTLTFEGTITFGVAHWEGPLVVIRGENVKVNGVKGSKFDGDGAKYWDGKGGPGKPLLMSIYGSGHYYDVNVLNCPERCVTFEGKNFLIEGWNIDVSAGIPHSRAVNSDGFGLVGTNIVLRNSVVKNLDDCVVTGFGSNMHISNIHCYGSHGLSLAVGHRVVSNITFTDCSLTDARIGIHIKNIVGAGPGLIQDITYNRITMSGIWQTGIYIQQDYPKNDGHTEGNVPYKGITLSNIQGTMSGKDSIPVKVTCHPGACSNWKFTNINIKGKKPCVMNYHPPGFSC